MSNAPSNDRFTKDEVKTLLENIRSEWKPVIENFPSLVKKIDRLVGKATVHEDNLVVLSASHRVLHRDMKEVKADIRKLNKRVGVLETKFA